MRRAARVGGRVGVAVDARARHSRDVSVAARLELLAGCAAVEAMTRPSRDGSRVPYFFLGDPDQEKKRGNRWAAGLPKLFAQGVVVE